MALVKVLGQTMDAWSNQLMQLEDIHLFEFGMFGLEENLKALPICLKESPFIVLEGDGAVIGGMKNLEGSFPLCPKFTMAKQSDT